MLARNKTRRESRWYLLVIVLTGFAGLSSCVSTTLNTTGSASMTGNEAYADIKMTAEQLEYSGDPDAHEMFIEKSRAFIKAHPKYKRVDEVYYLLGTSLMQRNRAEEGIAVFEELIRYYPTADYVEPSLLMLGLAYDKAGEHDKADPLYEKLVNRTRDHGRSRYSEIAQQLLEQDRDARTGELADASAADTGPSASQFINKPALDFQVTDLWGESLSLSQYRGQVVLLDFWATWCSPCIAEMPNVKRTYAKYKNQKFEIIGISSDQSTAPLEAYIADKGLTWRQYWDNNDRIGNMYNVRSIPSTFLIDGAGIIRQVNLRGSALETAVAALVQENLEN